jgi:hypothetical protein
MTTQSDLLRKSIQQEFGHASSHADIERLRAVYAAHGPRIRQMLDEDGLYDTPEQIVLVNVMRGLRSDIRIEPYLDLLTVFFRELIPPYTQNAHRTMTVVFAELVRIDAFYNHKDTRREEHERWFEAIRRVVGHMVDVCGLPIHHDAGAEVALHRSLKDLAVAYVAWASLFAFAPYIGGLPEQPLERFVKSVRYLEPHGQWSSQYDYIMERLMRMTPDDELARIDASMQRYKDGPIRQHLQAETERRQNAARELALRTGSMMMQRPSWGHVVMRETILGDMIMDLAFGRATTDTFLP